MARYLIYGRTEYPEPLEQVGEIDWDGVGSAAEAGVGTDWLELVLIPAEDVVWLQRDGAPVRQHSEVEA